MWHYKKGNKPLDSLAGRFYAQYFIKPQFEKFGTGEGLLGYGICARCQKQPSLVRDASFRSPPCSKQASVVRKGYSVPETPSYGTGCIFSAHNQKRGCRKTAPLQSIHAGNLPSTSNSPDSQTTHPTIKPQLFDFDTTRSRNFLLLNTLRQRNGKHTVHHLSLNGVKVDVFRKSKALMV